MKIKKTKISFEHYVKFTSVNNIFIYPVTPFKFKYP